MIFYSLASESNWRRPGAGSWSSHRSAEHSSVSLVLIQWPWNQTSTAPGVVFGADRHLCRGGGTIAFSGCSNKGRSAFSRSDDSGRRCRIMPLPLFSFSKTPHPCGEFWESLMALVGFFFTPNSVASMVSSSTNTPRTSLTSIAQDGVRQTHVNQP